jgi:hypothetical protein
MHNNVWYVHISGEKHYIGFGTYGHTVTLSYPALMVLGNAGILRVRKGSGEKIVSHLFS